MTSKFMDSAIDDLRRRLRAALQTARTQRGAGATHINTAGRKNIVVSKDVGQEGSTHTAVAVQVAPVRQKGSDSRASGGG
jgi:hypothetical protein